MCVHSFCRYVDIIFRCYAIIIFISLFTRSLTK